MIRYWLRSPGGAYQRDHDVVDDPDQDVVGDGCSVHEEMLPEQGGSDGRHVVLECLGADFASGGGAGQDRQVRRRYGVKDLGARADGAGSAREVPVRPRFAALVGSGRGETFLAEHGQQLSCSWSTLPG
jgi:hypothetical protein